MILPYDANQIPRWTEFLESTQSHLRVRVPTRLVPPRSALDLPACGDLVVHRDPTNPRLVLGRPLKHSWRDSALSSTDRGDTKPARVPGGFADGVDGARLICRPVSPSSGRC